MLWKRAAATSQQLMPKVHGGEIHFFPRDYFLNVKGGNLRGGEAK